MVISLSSESSSTFHSVRKISLTEFFSWVFSLMALFFLAGMVAFLFQDGLAALRREGMDFFVKADWHYRASRFGAASMIYGSAVVSGVAILSSLPLAFGSAIMTSEYLSGMTRVVAKSLIEFLAGIPSVVYGLLGVLFLRPFIFETLRPFHPESGDNLLTAGLLVGVMILPTVMSLSDDAFRGVPKEDREVARALGLTRQETFFHAVLPKALPGLVAAVLLGLGRALGETIAVYLVVGRADNRLPDPWYSLRPWIEAGQTLTSKLGGSEVNIAYGNPEHWSALVALGLALFIGIVALVLVSEGLLLAARRKHSWDL